MNDLELVAAHLQEAYAHVAQGRLAAGAATPGFLLVVTRLGCLWRFREDLTASVVVDLARLAGREGPAASLTQPPDRLEPLRRVIDAPAPTVRFLRHDAHSTPRFSTHERAPTDDASVVAALYAFETR